MRRYANQPVDDRCSNPAIDASHSTRVLRVWIMVCIFCSGCYFVFNVLKVSSKFIFPNDFSALFE